MFRPRTAVLMATLVLIPNLAAVAQVFLTQQTTDPATGLPVKNAPYTAEGRTTINNKLADGTTLHKEYSLGTVARDSKGRCYWAVVRQNTIAGRDGWLNVMQVHIWNPVAGVVTDWSTDSRITRVRAITGKEEILQNNLKTGGAETETTTQWKSTEEKLDETSIEGILATGVRTTSVSQGSHEAEGNDPPVRIVREVWTSPELHVKVLEVLKNPRIGVTRSELFNIQRGEPDISQFQPPTGNVVSDARHRVAQP